MNSNSLPTIARLLNSKASGRGLPPLIYMTDEKRVPNPLAAINKLNPGSGVVFRHYAINDRVKLGHEIKQLCIKNCLILLVAGDYKLAWDLNADGFHLAEHQVLSPPLNMRLWRQRPNKIITAAVHSRKALLKCQKLGVDAALVSPIFPTKSHINQPSLGVTGFQRMVYKTTVPIYALGGISKKNAGQLLNTPAIGIAGIGAIADNEQK
jgi:thiamine-phosphate pyrophosphorylase